MRNQNDCELTKGSHKIRVEYFQDTGVASMSLRWIPPGETQEAVIPRTALSHNVADEPSVEPRPKPKAKEKPAVPSQAERERAELEQAKRRVEEFFNSNGRLRRPKVGVFPANAGMRELLDDLLAQARKEGASKAEQLLLLARPPRWRGTSDTRSSPSRRSMP